MSVYNLLEKRRACHHFLEGKKIPKKTFEKIAKGVSLTPSGYNAQPWSLLVIEEKEKLEKISEIAFGQEHIKKASAAVILIGDLKIGRNADKLLADWVKHGYCKEEKIPAYKNAFCKKRAKRKLREMCIRNCALACMNFMILAEEEGLATCPMLGFNQPQMIEFLDLSEDFIPVMLFAVGYEEKGKERKRLPRKKVSEFLFFEKFGGQLD